jgi:hypothetical protein
MIQQKEGLMRDDTLIIRKLTRGQVLCTVTSPDSVRYLKTELGRANVDDGLSYQGMKLACSSGEDYWYAVYEDMSVKSDANAIKKEIQHIFNSTEPFLSFMRLIMEASGLDAYPDIEHDFYFGGVLSAIENNDTLSNELVKLTSKSFFKKASSRNTHSERLRTVIDIMESEGIITSDDSGSHYIFTGKLSYHIALIERVLELIAPDILDDEEGEEEANQIAIGLL